MKNTIYKIGYLIIAFAIVSGCESPEAEINYTPAEYDFPQGISLATSNITNGSFVFTYTINSGDAYYVVVESGSTPPSNNNVFAGSAAGLIESGNFSLSENSVTVEDLCSASSYDVYVVQFTTDSFLSEGTTSISVTTNDKELAGTYDTVTNGDLSGNFGGSVVDFAGVVTITDNGDGTYTFDDTTGGIYPEYYGLFGFFDPVPWTFEVQCNEISDSFWTTLEAYGDWIGFDGIINADGTISVHWESAFGEVMDVVYTKQ